MIWIFRCRFCLMMKWDKFEGGISTIALLEKIREVINKRIQEKKKNEFTDLAPIDDIENGAEYLKALHWAIKKKKVKNIALAGPYGAGKSTRKFETVCEGNYISI